MPSQPEPVGRFLEGSARPSGTGLAELASLLRIVQRVESATALERLVCALAVHPEGGGFAAATLLRRVPGLELLELAARAETLPWSPPLLQALGAFTGPRPAGAAPEDERAGLAFAFEDLDGAAAEAWSRGVASIGSAGGAATPWRSAGVVGAAPLRREGELWALLVVEGRDGLADPDRVRLDAVMALAGEALAALVVREESRRRARHAHALADLARACVSNSNLAEVLRLATRAARAGSGARAAAMWLSAEAESPRLEAVEGPPGWRERVARGAEVLAREAMESGQPRCLDPAFEEPGLPPDVAGELGAIVLAPLVAYGRARGVIAAFLPGESGAGSARDQLPFLASLGDLAALAVDQAGRGAAFEALGRRMRELGARLRREEGLAMAGELALRAAAEARQPLASIGAFARRLQRELGPAFEPREYLEIIVRESERLERLLAAPAEAAAPEPPALRLESLNDVVQEALRHAGEVLVRRRVRLLKRLAPEVPPLLLDPVRVRRAIGNVLDHVLEALPMGGRMRVESRVRAGFAVLEMAHDGPHAPGEVLDQLFLPFASAASGGAEIGLAVARRIVQELGGEVRVRSEGEWSTVIALTFPVRGNQDRRKALRDRRSRRPDRRAGEPRPA